MQRLLQIALYVDLLADLEKKDAGAGILAHRNPLPAGDLGIGEEKIQDITGQLPGFPIPRGKQRIEDVRLQVMGRGNGQITDGLTNFVAVNLSHGSKTLKG